MVARRSGRICTFLYPKENGRRDTPEELERDLEEILFLLLHLETVPVGLSSHLAEPFNLFPVSVDATPVYPKEDHRGKASIPKPPILRFDIRILF